MASFLRHLEEEKAIQQLERWYKDMVKLQSLVNKGNWADDTDSKSFALHIAERICEDLQQRLQERKSHLTIVDHNPVSASDSDAEGNRANKRQQLDEQRMAGSKRDTHKTDKNSKKKQKLEDRNGEIMNQRIVPKEKANDDGLKWRKYGSKTIRNEIYPRDYYKCASNGCPGKRTVQVVDGEKVRIVYYKLHNCGTQHPLVMQQQQQHQQKEENAELVNEAQTEQQSSPIIPQEMCEDIMSYCQPNDGVLCSHIQEQQHDHSPLLSPEIAHNDEIGLELYTAGLIPHLQQQQSSTFDQSIQMFQSQSLDLSDLWIDEVNEEGCSR